MIHEVSADEETDAQKLPFDDASFDGVTMGFVLLHLPDPAQALQEALRANWHPPKGSLF